MYLSNLKTFCILFCNGWINFLNLLVGNLCYLKTICQHLTSVLSRMHRCEVPRFTYRTLINNLAGWCVLIKFYIQKFQFFPQITKMMVMKKTAKCTLSIHNRFKNIIHVLHSYCNTILNARGCIHRDAILMLS